MANSVVVTESDDVVTVPGPSSTSVVLPSPTANVVTIGTMGPQGPPGDLTASVILAPTTSARNVIQAQNLSTIPLSLRPATGSATVSMTEWQSSTGTVQSSVSPDGTAHRARYFHDRSSTRPYIDTELGVGTLGIVARSSTHIPLTLRAAASQSVALQEWQNSAGTVLSWISPSGNFQSSVMNTDVAAGYWRGTGITNYANSGAYITFGTTADGVTVLQRTASAVALVVRGAASQSSNLQEWQDSGINVRALVNSGGAAVFNAGGWAGSMGYTSGGGVGIATSTDMAGGSTTKVMMAFANTFTGSDVTWSHVFATVTPIVGNASAKSLRIGGSSSGSHIAFAPSTLSGDALVVTGTGTTTMQVGSAQTNIATHVLRKGAAQTGDFQQFQSNAGAVLAKIDSFGNSWSPVTVSGDWAAVPGGSVPLQAISTLSSRVVSIIKAAASQSADLLQYQDETGAVIGSVSSNATLVHFGKTQTISGTTNILTSNGRGSFGYDGTTQSAYVSDGSSAKPIRLSSTHASQGVIIQSASVGGGSAVPGQIPLVVKGVASQTAALQEWHSSAGTALAAVSNVGTVTGAMLVSNGNISLPADSTFFLGASAMTQSTGGALAIRGLTGNSNIVMAANADLYLVADRDNSTTGTARVFLAADAEGSTNTMLVAREDGLVGIGTGNAPIANTQLAVVSGAATTTTLVVKAAASQSANLQEWQTSSSSLGGYVSNNGDKLYMSNQLAVRGGWLTGVGTSLYAGSASIIPVVVRAAASQTTNMQEWQDSAGTVKSAIGSGGDRLLTTFLRDPTNAGGYIELKGGGAAGPVVTPGSASTVGLVVMGRASQTANLQEWSNSSGTVMGRITSGGAFSTDQYYSLGGGHSITAVGNGWLVRSSAATSIPVQTRGAASQTADLFQAQDSTGAVLASVDSAGGLHVPTIQVGTSTTAGYVLTADASGIGTWQSAASGSLAGAVILDPAVSTRNVIQPTATTATGLVLKRIASQSASVFEVQESTGAVLAKIRSSGDMFNAQYFGALSDSGVYLQMNSGGSAVFNNRTTASNIVTIVKGMASQSGDLTQWQDSANTVVSRITAPGDFLLAGSVRVGNSTSLTTGVKMHVSTSANTGILSEAVAATTTPIISKAAAAQTADLQQWQDSAGGVLTKITSTGDIILGATGSTTSAPRTLGFTTALTGSEAVRWAIDPAVGIQGGVGQRPQFYSYYGVVMVGGRASGTPPSYEAQSGTDFSLRVDQPAAAKLGLIVRAAASATANLQEWQDSSATVSTAVLSNGTVSARAVASGFGGAYDPVTSATAQAAFSSSNSGRAAAIFRGVASQTQNLTEWQSNTPTVLVAIGADGLFDYRAGLSVSLNRETLSGNKTLTQASPTYQILDAGAANRDCTFPASPVTGLSYFVKNNGASNNIVVKNSGGTTLATLTPGQKNSFVYDSTAWQVI